MPFAVPVLFWATGISFCLVLYFDGELRRSIQRHWLTIFFFILVALLWRLPPEGQFFYGLEYEDAYVYTVSGRDLSLGVTLPRNSGSPYLTTVCAVGSWKTCKITDTFSGHLLGYPYLIGILSDLLGFVPQLGAMVSLTASLGAILPIFLVGRMLNSGGIAGEAAALIYSITPIFAVHGVGAYAEPLSNFLVMFCLLFFLRTLGLSQSQAYPPLVANWLALTCIALLALMVKRENLVLLPVLAIFGMPFAIKRNASVTRIRSYLLMLLVGACLGLVLALELPLATSIVSERSEFSVFPFNWRTFQTMLPLFARSFALPGWYLVGLPFAVIGALSSIRVRRLGVFPTALLISYLLLYSSHVRSYYQLQAGIATPFDTIRYSINLAGLWSVLAGVGFSLWMSQASGKLIVYGRRKLALVVTISILGFALWGYLQTDSLKKEMLDNEFRVRIEPAQTAIRTAGEAGLSRTFVITHEPLLIQMLAPNPVNVIDFRYLETDLLRELQGESPSAVFLYLEETTYLSKADRERYAKGFKVIELTKKIKLVQEEAFTLYWLDVSIFH